MTGTEVREVRLDALNKVPTGELVGLRCVRGQDTKLVFVHGSRTPLRKYQQLLSEFLKAGEHDVYVFRYNSYWGSADDIASSLKGELQGLLRREPKSRLILVGHSLGGVLVRRATLDLYGENPSDLDRIIRLVLLSSTNRGFEPVTLSQGVGRQLADLLRYHPPILDGLRGSTWITKLRIDWLEKFGGVQIRPKFNETSNEEDVVTIDKEVKVVPAHPLTVLIDGNRDRVIRPEDSADLEIFEGAIHHVPVEGIGHFDFTLSGLLPGADGGESCEWRQARELDAETKVKSLEKLADVIRGAVVGEYDPKSEPRRPGPGFGLALGAPQSGAGGAACTPAGWLGKGGQASLNIVFMIHGIRDYGSWHPWLSESLEAKLADTPGLWRIVPVEYGYFSALQFLLPVQQKRVVYGFVDRYLNEMVRAFRLMLRLRRFLTVRVHIAAHSNGCNILAQAIERDAALSFSRVFLAGCVLRKDFWSRHPSRAFSVRNDCATDDWPVGVLCRFLGKFPTPGYWFLGPAGVDGFSGPSVVNLARRGRPFPEDSKWLTGDHGAAIEPVRIDTIADYLITGLPSVAPVTAGQPSPMRGERFVFWSLALTVAVVAIALVACLYALSGVPGVGLGLLLVVLALAVVFVMLNV
jgi:pimeloyl-ACP methyl ester carboxylesterase